MKIYLSGGLRSNWQDRVIEAIDADFFDPRILNTGGRTLDNIAEQERNWIFNADAVFAYLEKDNPSGLGLAAEVAYAQGLGIPMVMLVDEKGDRYSEFLHSFADEVHTSLDAGIEALKGYLTL